MTPDHDEFRDLRRLLALKRHEQPPPGYFESFSSQVIQRITANQRVRQQSLTERLFGPGSFWLRRLASFQSSPLMAGTFGAAACALLISGIVYSERPTAHATSNIPQLAVTEVTLAPAQAQAPAPSVNRLFFGPSTQVAENPTVGWVPATVVHPDSLFDQIKPRMNPDFKVQPASFQQP